MAIENMFKMLVSFCPANVPPTPSERMPTNTQTTPHPCVQPLDAGPCDGKISRYYFDAGTKQCLQFTYGGCRGNDNNFDNFEACRSWCLTGKFEP